MITKDKINQLATELVNAVSPKVKEAGDSVKKTFVSILKNAATKTNLITRDEFDAQTEKLEKLQKKVAGLERKLKKNSAA